MEPTFKDFILNELQDMGEVREVENHLSQMFADIGVSGAQFTKHARDDRALGRDTDITQKEISELFLKFKKMHGPKMLQGLKEKGRYQAVIKDFGSQVNMVIDVDGGILKIVTMMRKPPNQFKGDAWSHYQQLKVW